MKSILVRLMTGFIRMYQLMLSPWMANHCRFTPSCSRYAILALQIHGPWDGLVLTMRRLARCRPGGGCGCDPVPQKV